MLEVTEYAREKLKVLLEASTEDPAAGIRLTIAQSGQLGIVIDNEKPGDQVVEHKGSKVLLLDSIVSEAMSSFTLDTEETVEGNKFTLKEKTED